MIMSVCACECVSVRDHITRTSLPIVTKFLCVLAMAVIRFSFGRIGMSCVHVLPVL